MSYPSQGNHDVDPTVAFLEVGEDLRLLTLDEVGTSEISEADDANVQPLKNAKPLKTAAKRLGRLPNQERRNAIRAAIRAHGKRWRDHLSQILVELDHQEVHLGDFQLLKIDLGDGQRAPVSNWADLDFACGKQRKQIIDRLRKYDD